MNYKKNKKGADKKGVGKGVLYPPIQLPLKKRPIKKEKGNKGTERNKCVYRICVHCGEKSHVRRKLCNNLLCMKPFA